MLLWITCILLYVLIGTIIWFFETYRVWHSDKFMDEGWHVERKK